MQGRVVLVYLDDALVIEGTVENEGCIYLANEHLKSKIENPEVGQIYWVMCSSVALFSKDIQDDSLQKEAWGRVLVSSR